MLFSFLFQVHRLLTDMPLRIQFVVVEENYMKQTMCSGGLFSNNKSKLTMASSYEIKAETGWDFM